MNFDSVRAALGVEDAPASFVSAMQESTISQFKEYLASNKEVFFPTGVNLSDSLISSVFSQKGIENYALVDRDTGKVKIYASISVSASGEDFELLHFGYNQGIPGTPTSALVTVSFVNRMIVNFHGASKFNFCTYSDTEGIVPQVLRTLSMNRGISLFNWTIRAEDPTLYRRFAESFPLEHEELLRQIESLPRSGCSQGQGRAFEAPGWQNESCASINSQNGRIVYNGSYYSWDCRFYYDSKMLIPVLSMISEEGEVDYPEVTIYSPLPPSKRWYQEVAAAALPISVSSPRPMRYHDVPANMTERWDRIVERKKGEIYRKYRFEVLPGSRLCFCGWDKND